MNEQSLNIEVKTFYKLISQLNNERQVEDFTRCLCSESELKELVKRFVILRELKSGKKSLDLIKKFPQEAYTIARIIFAMKNL